LNYSTESLTHNFSKVKKMVEWSEEEYKKEAKRLGWSVEYLKAHIRKEERIKEVFDNLKNE